MDRKIGRPENFSSRPSTNLSVVKSSGRQISEQWIMIERSCSMLLVLL